MAAINRFEAAELGDDALVREFLTAAVEVGHRNIDIVDSLGALATPEEAPTPQALDRVTEAQQVLTERFSTEERPLTPEDFGAIALMKEGQTNLFVALTAEKGLKRGSFNQIMSADKTTTGEYTVELDGQLVDTRTVMTRRLHRAIVLRRAAQTTAPIRQVPQLPEHAVPRNGTWYTGDRPTAGLAPFGYDDDIFPERMWREPRGVFSSILLRPGVKIPT